MMQRFIRRLSFLSSSETTSSAGDSSTSRADTKGWDYVAKVVLVGDVKSCGNFFNSWFPSSQAAGASYKLMGSDFGIDVRQSNEKKVRLQVWNTSMMSQEQFPENYLNYAHVCVIFCGLDNQQSFVNTRACLKKISEKPIITIVVAAQSDEDLQVVSEVELSSLSEEYGALVKTQVAVEALIAEIAARAIEKVASQNYIPRELSLSCPPETEADENTSGTILQ